MSDKTVTVVETTNSVNITSTQLEVVSVGTQGPPGPTQIGGEDLPSAQTPPSDGDMLKYDAASGEWVYTQEIDAGTY